MFHGGTSSHLGGSGLEFCGLSVELITPRHVWTSKKQLLIHSKYVLTFCFEQSGVLLGIAIRTGSPLSLNLAEPVWKQLAGMSLTIADLSEVIDLGCGSYKGALTFLGT